MWKTFTVSQNVYMIQLQKSESGHTLLITDLCYTWKSVFSLPILVDIFKEQNPLIEASDHQISSHFLEMIDNLQTCSISVDISEESLVMTLEKDCSGQGLIYKFKLDREPQEEFKKLLVVPMLKSVYYLEEQQKTLLDLIQKKDRELEEFRMEKGEISRDDLKTEKFDRTLLEGEKPGMLLNVFTAEMSKDFWKQFSATNGEVRNTTLSVELEPWNSKKRKNVLYSGKNKVVKMGSGVVYKK